MSVFYTNGEEVRILKGTEINPGSVRLVMHSDTPSLTDRRAGRAYGVCVFLSLCTTRIYNVCVYVYVRGEK